MSDHPKVQQRHLKEIYVCDDNWLGVFGFIGRAKLGLKLALLSDRFDGLVDLHFKTRRWTLGQLIYGRIRLQTTHFPYDGRLHRFDFGRISHVLLLKLFGPRNLDDLNRYVDQSVIDFHHCIQRLFESGSLDLNKFYSPDVQLQDYVIRMIWPFIVERITRLEGYIELLQHRYFINVLRDCANLRSIFPYGRDRLPNGLLLANEAVTLNQQALFKWLHIPRGDGQPKVLELEFDQLYDHMSAVVGCVEGLKETFRNAFTSVNFIIVLNLTRAVSLKRFGILAFEVQNQRTRERLALRCVKRRPNWGDDACLIERRPIAGDDEQWTKWSREVIEKKWIHLIDILELKTFF